MDFADFNRGEKRDVCVMFLPALGEVPFCLEIIYAFLCNTFGRIERKAYFLYVITIFWLSMSTEPAWNYATIVLGCNCWSNSIVLMKVMKGFSCSCDLRGPERGCGQKHGREAHCGNISPSDGVQKDVEEAEVRAFAKGTLKLKKSFTKLIDNL